MKHLVFLLLLIFCLSCDDELNKLKSNQPEDIVTHKHNVEGKFEFVFKQTIVLDENLEFDPADEISQAKFSIQNLSNASLENVHFGINVYSETTKSLANINYPFSHHISDFAANESREIPDFLFAQPIMLDEDHIDIILFDDGLNPPSMLSGRYEGFYNRVKEGATSSGLLIGHINSKGVFKLEQRLDSAAVMHLDGFISPENILHGDIAITEASGNNNYTIKTITPCVTSPTQDSIFIHLNIEEDSTDSMYVQLHKF